MTKRFVVPIACKHCGNKDPKIEKVGGVYNHQFRLKCSCGTMTPWFGSQNKAIRNWNFINTEQMSEKPDVGN